MSDKETGGPAFPHVDSGCGRFEAGMTLRDYFATKAMQGLMPMSQEDLEQYVPEHKGTTFQLIATISYDMADAMMEARK